MKYLMYPIDFSIGALGALYIVTDLVIEFIGDEIVSFVRRTLS